MGSALSKTHLPRSSHIARYCGPSRILENGNISGAVFLLRADEDYLSVNWLERLPFKDRNSQVKEVRKRSQLVPSSGARIAVLNVGEICEHVKTESSYTISVLHEPIVQDDSHSGIHGTAQDQLMISELIAEKVLESHPAKEK